MSKPIYYLHGDFIGKNIDRSLEEAEKVVAVEDLPCTPPVGWQDSGHRRVPEAGDKFIGLDGKPRVRGTTWSSWGADSEDFNFKHPRVIIEEIPGYWDSK